MLMKSNKNLALLALAGAVLLPVADVSAQLFSENFDGGTSGSSWTALKSGTDSSADFAFDYSTIGLPSAPHSSGSSTIGMRFLVNQSGGAFQGISASPNGQSFTGDFTLRFDMWLNYNGDLNGGGLGSTQVGTFGWGTSGSSVQWAGASSSIMFGATGDGGSGQDYRAYKNNALLVPSTGVYAAGTSLSPDSRNAADPYYTSRFGGETAPAAQLALYPQQTNATPAGTLGMAWRDVEVTKSGNTMTWIVDGELLATVDTSDAALSGDNIFFGMFDVNSGSSADPNDFLITAIYDNIQVVPEPSTYAMALMGAAGAIFAMRRRRK